MSSNKTNYLYWIHNDEMADPFVEGYVGVSNNPNSRFSCHKRKNLKSKINSWLKKHKEGKMSILMFGCEEDMYAMEKVYRPKENIGLNLKEGGYYPPSPFKGIKRPEHSVLMSGENHPMFGNHHKEETKEKIRQANSGENHFKTKLTWGIVNKIRKEYEPKMGKCKELGKKYGVSASAINAIISNRTWKDPFYNKPKSIMSKLSWDKVKQMREEYTGKHGEKKKLAEKFNIHRKTMENILNNKTWKDS